MNTAIDFYRQEQANHSLLTSSDERRLLERAVAGETAAVSELVDHNQRMVMSIAIHYHLTPAAGYYPETRIELMDLVQEGNLGLLTAIRKFDLSSPWRFSTYAVWWVKQRIRRYCFRYGQPGNFSHADSATFARVRAVYANLCRQHSEEPAFNQVAQAAGLPVSTVEMFFRSYRHFSLDKPLPSDDDIADLIPDPSSLDWQSYTDNDLDVSALLADLECHNPRARLAIEMRFGLNGHTEHRYHQIGAAMGCSRTGAQDLVIAGLKHIRSTLETGNISA